MCAKRSVGQLTDALIRPDLSRQARQARQARQRSGQRPGQRPGSQTLHLCMFQRPRAIKHYTCACLSACGAPNITHMQIRALKSHLDRQWHSESTFGHGCTDPEFEKRRTKAHLYTVARFLNLTFWKRVVRLHGFRIWSRRCACHDSNYAHKAETRFLIMATRPKRSLNSLELRLCTFGAARTLWSYACACLELHERFGVTPVHVRRSTEHKKIQEIMK